MSCELEIFKSNTKLLKCSHANQRENNQTKYINLVLLCWSLFGKYLLDVASRFSLFHISFFFYSLCSCIFERYRRKCLALFICECVVVGVRGAVCVVSLFG